MFIFDALVGADNDCPTATDVQANYDEWDISRIKISNDGQAITESLAKKMNNVA